jgi:hypothetical protein
MNCCLIAAFGSALALAGCKSSPPSAAPEEESAEYAEHEHEHDHAHAHPEEGPHHGHLIELGDEEYHAELTHDEATHTITIYLLDKEAKNPVSIADSEITLNLAVDGKPVQAILAAQPQEADPAGQASRFSVTDEKALEALESPKATGRLNVTIEGKPYSGAVEHHEHGDHEH